MKFTTANRMNIADLPVGLDQFLVIEGGKLAFNPTTASAATYEGERGTIWTLGSDGATIERDANPFGQLADDIEEHVQEGQEIAEELSSQADDLACMQDALDGVLAFRKKAATDDRFKLEYPFYPYIDRPDVKGVWYKYIGSDPSPRFIVVNPDSSWEARSSKYKDQPPLETGEGKAALDQYLASFGKTKTAEQLLPDSPQRGSGLELEFEQKHVPYLVVTDSNGKSFQVYQPRQDGTAVVRPLVVTTKAGDPEVVNLQQWEHQIGHYEVRGVAEGKKLVAMLKSLGFTKTAPPKNVKDTEKWRKAEEATKKEYGEVEDHYGVVNHIYQNMGGTFAAVIAMPSMTKDELKKQGQEIGERFLAENAGKTYTEAHSAMIGYINNLRQHHTQKDWLQRFASEVLKQAVKDGKLDSRFPWNIEGHPQYESPLEDPMAEVQRQRDEFPSKKGAKDVDTEMTVEYGGDGDLAELVQYVIDNAAGGHSFEVAVDPDDGTESFSFDGDGNFTANDVETKDLTEDEGKDEASEEDGEKKTASGINEPGANMETQTSTPPSQDSLDTIANGAWAKFKKDRKGKYVGIWLHPNAIVITDRKGWPVYQAMGTYKREEVRELMDKFKALGSGLISAKSDPQPLR